MEKCYDDGYVIHDGKKVKRVISPFIYELEKKEEEHLKKQDSEHLLNILLILKEKMRDRTKSIEISKRKK